ncbi:hypothetical protein [Bosea psychrotolerans]|uniref:hypothetical protein n=1 Tax=Bosea psychrotolerans TaxID=1871628 RepID=UPI0015E18FD6|nr:hypothetical protein [Bosea psychrotolerans]
MKDLATRALRTYPLHGFDDFRQQKTRRPKGGQVAENSGTMMGELSPLEASSQNRHATLHGDAASASDDLSEVVIEAHGP